MQERSHNFEEGTDESEVTLAAPRFDADEARHAHPVVPLDEVPAGTDARAGRAPYRGGARRQWPLSLIVVALLASAALGGVATKVLHRAHTTPTPAPVSADAAQDRQPQTDTAPTQTNTTPTQTATAPSQEDATAAQQRSAPAPTAASEEKAAAGAEKTEERTPRRTRKERAARPGRGEEIQQPPEAARVERREADGGDVERRGHFKGRDGRDEERDSRKASKHQKKGGARLVDVIVGSPRP